jgi:hypothetical protein
MIGTASLRIHFARPERCWWVLDGIGSVIPVVIGASPVALLTRQR